MATEITHIDSPQEWQITDGYNSHRPLLWLAANNTQGVIVEAGMGEGSTNLLETIKDRKVQHYETSREWIEKFDTRIKPVHVNYWLEDNLFPENIGLLFVDCAPGEVRKDLLYKYRNSASVIVIHDTENDAQNVYGIREFLKLFRYRLDYQPKGYPFSTAISNFIEVEAWVK